ncbi:MAG: hypothetical protein AAB364_02815 [Patescibacteria group bacterium]
MIFLVFWFFVFPLLGYALYLACLWYGAHLLTWLHTRLSWHLGWRTDYDPVTGKIRGSKRFWNWAIIHMKPKLDEIFEKEKAVEQQEKQCLPPSSL